MSNDESKSAEENPENTNEFDGTTDGDNVPGTSGDMFTVSGMYREWFLDYASYVILERAVPALYDGLKPVQRRILHSMKDLDDGRYNKVANIIGHTMKYHPHGDASIGDALVQLGQKDLLIDMQGNWGNTLTGDSAAAPRYIEARLSKFALEVVFNPKTTEWQSSYDGRNKEPVFLPVKFPLLLAQGGEGIAVGLSCKMLPHNFNELIDASVAYLRGRSFNLKPDFPTGGMADVENYNNGLRGGKVRVRARIRKEDNKTLVIHEVPFGSTTSSLIDSILKANDKGKIKIKKIEDNTAAEAEITVHLPSGVSPDKTIDALYAFTDCEISISPNACVIENDSPRFLGISDLLKASTDNTKALLQLELEIRKQELQEQWHFNSLERIFIEKRIYRDIEESETWEEVIAAIDAGVHKFISTPSRITKGKGVLSLIRDVTEEDLVRLTEIKIKRISKFDSKKAEDQIRSLEEKLAEVQSHLDDIVQYAIDYFKELKKKYGAGRERKTELKSFETIQATKVVATNKKLYIDRKEGFIGYSMRGTEQISECSDIDDIIVFRDDGKMLVTKIADKKFVGKGILHAAVWKKGDARTIYHLIYQDGTKGGTFVKRFAVTGITRDKEYDLSRGTKGSRLLHFSANPNGVSEIVKVILRPRPNLRKLKFDVDFGEIAIKGRGAKGNLITKHMVSKVEVKEKGASTLGARNIWIDETVMRLNTEERGRYLGEFEGDDMLLVVQESGQYQLLDPTLDLHFPDDAAMIVKHDPKMIMNVIYWDGIKQQHNVKRFDLSTPERTVLFITEHDDSKLELFSIMPAPEVTIEYDKRSSNKEDETIALQDLISVKGVKAKGNKLTSEKVKSFTLNGPVFDPVATATKSGPAPEDFDDHPGPEELGLEESPVQAKRRELVLKKRRSDGGFTAGNQITLELDN
jgi:topoisomerase-4 subunit A